MVWGYLTQFWEAIVEVGLYPVIWFENVGNAVAGAIGGLFEDLIHHVYDIFYFNNWLLENLAEIFFSAFTPLTWSFNFFKGFLASATSQIEELGLQVEDFSIYTDNVKAFFDMIPYFNIITAGISGILGLLFLVFIVKQLRNI